MRKINWKKKGDELHAIVGNISLGCYCYKTLGGKSRWMASVYLHHIGKFVSRGPMRYSLSKAKEDVVRLVYEFLLDYQAVIALEMKNFED